MNLDSLLPKSRRIAERLIEAFPECEKLMKSERGILTVVWPSKSPYVLEPLELRCEFEPSLYWFKGYMYDFIDWPGDDGFLQADRIVEFLEGFFAEEYACAVDFRDGQVMGGGPVRTADLEAKTGWWSDSTIQIRSWKGKYDRG